MEEAERAGADAFFIICQEGKHVLRGRGVAVVDGNGHS